MGRKSIGHFFLNLFGVLTFCAVSAYALFLAYGYQYDLNQRNVKKTSIIDLASHVKDVQVLLNDQVVDNSDLPYQIKDVLPGTYSLAIKKDNYLPWNRQLKVLTDIVTKVPDILLVPINLDEYRKDLIRFVDDSRFFSDKNTLVVLRPKQNFFTAISFADDGSISQNELKISNLAGVSTIDLLPQNRFLIHYLDGTVEWVTSNGSRTAFVLPKGIDRLTFSSFDDNSYFLKSGTLYKVPVSQMAQVTDKTLVASKVIDHIEQFTLSKNAVYFLQNGNLFSSDYSGGNITSLEGSYGHLTNLNYLADQNYSFLILRSTEKVRGSKKTVDHRSLYFLDSKGALLLMTDTLSGDPLFNSLGQTLFSTAEKDIFVFDPRLNEKVLVQQLATNFKLLSWFGDVHFLYQDSDIHLADLSFSNPYSLGFQDKAGQFFMKGHALFYLLDNQLKVLYWDKN